MAAAARDAEEPGAQRGHVEVAVAREQDRRVELLAMAATDTAGLEAVAPAEGAQPVERARREADEVARGTPGLGSVALSGVP